jgi:beta-lactamase regulating signal transducer with metallopeptidase domain
MGLTALLALHASGWLRMLMEASAKAAVVLALALLITLAARRASAAWRHLLWTVGLGAALCLPLLLLAVPARRVTPAPRPHATRPTSPRVEVPVPQAQRSPAALPLRSAPTVPAAQPPQVTTAATAPPPPPPPPRTPKSEREKPVPLRSHGLPQLALLAWAMGALAVLLPVLIGVRETRRLLRGSQPVTDPSWGELLKEGRAQLSLHRPVRLVRAAGETIPMAWGWRRPVVLLPASAEGWSAARKRIVLRHELAHVKRGDWGSQMLGYVTTALYWFNPLVWLALRRLQREREQACDDLVLHAGFRASDYAEELMGLVRGLQRPPLAALAAVAMARATGLEGRLQALLEANRNRTGVTRRAALIAVAAVAVLLVPLSTLKAFPAAGAASGAQRELGAGPAGATLYLWDPDQTWFGDAKYDPRLDQPVQFWRAGLSLAEVFAGIEEQTGAKIGFWPEGADNPRVRVNLYLNPDQPPTLRAVMAQLMWATDCAMGYTQGENGFTYYLLGTSLGGGLSGGLAVLETRAAERAPKPAPQTQATHGSSRDDPATIKGRLDDLRQALSLSREEAIAGYRGVDDYLLLTLVDPARRAAAEYMCAVAGQDFQPSDDDWSVRKWSELSESERDLVWRALQFRQPGERDLIGKTEVEVMVFPHGNALTLRAAAEMGNGHLLMGRFYRLAVTPEEGFEELDRLYPDEILAFAENLGETVPEDTEQDYVANWKSDLSAKRRGAELRLAAKNAGLSQENRKRLDIAAVSLKQGASYTLWEVQEAVAAASGLNVISDCFWQPRRPLYQTDSWVDALASASEPWAERARTSFEPVWLAGWEWGDAGSFLRFRSLDRDVWRASFLPAKTVTELDAYLQAFLPKEPGKGWPEDGFSLRLKPDTFALLKLAVRLNDFQLAYGGRLLYDDPADPVGACRQALREALLGVVTQRPSHDATQTERAISNFRFIASLTSEQWQSARGRGLPCDKMTEEQLARLPKCLSEGEWDSYKHRLSLLLLKAGDFLNQDPDRRGEPLWFYVTLVQPKESFTWLPEVPQEHRRDLNLFEWVCYRHVDVSVPAPLRPAARTEKTAAE